MSKLYIHDDAPPDVKQTVGSNQKGLDNVEEFKAKADAEELTRDDLRELSRRQLNLVTPYLVGNPAAVGLLTAAINQDTLRNLAKQRLLETQSLLKQRGGPAIKVSSIEELQKFSGLSPETLEKQMLDSVEKTRQDSPQMDDGVNDDNVKKKKKTKKKLDLKFGKTKIGYSTALADEIFENLVFTYLQCKPAFFNLTSDWPEIENSEKMLQTLIEPINENGDLYIGHIFSLFVDAEDPVEKETAAYVLCSVRDGESSIIKELIEIAREEEENLPFLQKALCYGTNSIIPVIAAKNLQVDEILATIFAEVLDYQRYEESLSELLEKSPPLIQAKILKKQAKVSTKNNFKDFYHLLEEPQANFYEDAVLAGLLGGDYKALVSLRELFTDSKNLKGNLPLLLACSGGVIDFRAISQSLPDKKIPLETIQALGIFGIPIIIPKLIELLNLDIHPIADEDDLNLKNSVFESLELITGAQLSKPDLDIVEGPEGEEYKLSVILGYEELWSRWWLKNLEQFDLNTRFRRGIPFTLQGCLEEMANPRGNYWSRQFSYLELMIRSGIKHPFEADWYVQDQLAAVENWRLKTADDSIMSQVNTWCFGGKG